MNVSWTARLRGMIEAHDEADMGTPASQAEIAAAEAALGVVFPQALKTYLHTFGHVELASQQLYGLGKDIPAYLSIIAETLVERTEFRPYIPVHLLPMCNNGGGDHYCIDLSSGDDDPPVVFWSHEDDERQTPDVVAESFSSWLLALAEECLAS